MAKDKGVLTVGVVTLPFENEGENAMSRAIDGIHELVKNVDSLLIINNEKLYDFSAAISCMRRSRRRTRCSPPP